MCSLPPRESITKGWYSDQIAENDFSLQPTSATSSNGTPKIKERPSKTTTGSSQHKNSPTPATTVGREAKSRRAKLGPQFLTPEIGLRLQDLNVTGASTHHPKQHLTSKESQIISYEKYKQIQHLIEAGERLDRRIRKGIKEAMSTPITHLQPGDIEPNDFILVERDLNLFTEDGWDLVDDEIPRASTWKW